MYPSLCARVLRALQPALLRVLMMLSLLSGGGFGGASSFAADAAQTQAPAAQAEEAYFFNRPFVTFRASLLGATPEQRARRAERNVQAVLESGKGEEVTITSNALGNIVLLGGEMVFILTASDADQLEGETLEAVTNKTITRLQKVIAESRESRDAQFMMWALAIAMVETLVFLILLWLATRLWRWATARLLAQTSSRAGKLQLGGAELIRADRVLAVVRWLLRVCYSLLLLLLTYAWLSLVLARFPYTRAWGEQLNDYLLDVLATVGGGILGAIPNLLIVVITFLLARGAVSIMRPLFDRVETGQAEFSWLDADTIKPTRRIVNVLIWIFALVMAYPYLPGANTEAFKGMSVLIGLMVSLGASSVVGQAASGLILMYARTIRTGEFVRIGEYEGTIMELGMFTTRLRTGRGAEITLPNSMIVGSATQNYSRAVKGKGYIVDTMVTIGYDTPWRQVEAMLKEAAGRTPGILSDPAPRVFQTALSDFYPEYCLACQAIPEGSSPRAEVLSALHANIQDVFNEYGVQIMSPNYEADPESAKLVPQANWYAAPATPPKSV